MLTKRIIPCLDVDDGRVVKGVNFVNIVDAGDPVELAKIYNNEGADELVFLDITASSDNRKIMIDIVKKVAKKVFIPFTVGGGIRTIEDIKNNLIAGADKIAINTSAVKNPQLIKRGASMFGSQCIVVAIDAKKQGNSWEVFINGGRTATRINVYDWVQKVVQLGAGEILLTSMDRDGTKDGYDIELTKKISENVSVPVIASGGAGSLQDFAQIFNDGKADGALAASLFHYDELKIADLKQYLLQSQIPMRIT
ncbi:imidazole glycerol phosphate synthase subunit HisF [Candidatus Roizmanbacteria bacterium RIFCSPHIGHO2_02_FULL_37_13b]|uniref:Imidazole glycerol phosphate synthase subunit HisF n=1 Tax=Candidatus Roizmanbacteria bacterium RIFCSPLOWO2_02_FULL_36_11 TaxID=1802071 RepID=A0A1F7JCD7_9BACT|nr:MAG: imidazole glycerol phosphate synthase subunit HisF [Candidatus Roizmanbacteria bacterium RIFCSPHIGHO2_02_FULL_37_13b]OGK53273.1 MAG: imidazole glycerol phosphate synthase subunit HisF [Candidatus Roizmanbacteria bacterium RIFCSPLOWO2_02_FULL_36_11]